ncbi:acyl carrier protein [Accumulibacter sp.]|uniref:acyl carrier protein n=1 Tax=Accumulibacter sp. TaxID=2053492 RepID=UPI0026128FCE|nr:acyl carrier protein [Accumulibacter sp.]
MDELLKLIATALKLPIGDIAPATSMKTCAAWDSLAHMEIVIGIEEHYRIVLDGDEIADMVSVAAIVDQLRKRGLLDHGA